MVLPIFIVNGVIFVDMTITDNHKDYILKRLKSVNNDVTVLSSRLLEGLIKIPQIDEFVRHQAINVLIDREPKQQEMELKPREEKDLLGVMGSEEIKHLKDKDTEWIVDNLIPIGCTFISAIPASYKSFITQHIAVGLATSEPIFSYFKTQKEIRTLIIDRENPTLVVKKRIFKQLYPNGETNLPIWWCFSPTPIINEDWKAQLFEFIKSLKINLLIIDSFRRFHPGDENDSAAIAKTFQFMDEIKKLNVSIIAIHHHRKSQMFGKKDLDQSMRGSSDIQAYPDCHLAIEKTFLEGSWQLKITQVKIRVAEPISPFLVDVIHPNDDEERVDFKFKLFVPHEEEKPYTCRLDVLGYLQRVNFTDRQQLISEFENKYGRNMLIDSIEALVRENKATKEKEGRKNIYSILASENTS